MSQSPSGIDVSRVARVLALIGFVTAVFLFLAAERLSGVSLRVGIVAIGSVGVLTAIVGVLIGLASTIGSENPEDDGSGEASSDRRGEPTGTAGDHDRQ